MCFKKDFAWGAATASYQVEGAAKEDGRGLSVWDVFCEKHGKVKDATNGDIACDHYHKYEEDVSLMAQMGLKAYRFSVSWSRIMPNGTGEVNQKGIDFYNNLIDCLLKHDIEPYLTLFHWDLPYALHKKGGWLNDESPEWFAAYTKVIAENFSDRVKYFFTFNEPQCFVGLGYLGDYHAPGLNGPDRDAFAAAHNVLKAHGRVVQVLREYSSQPVKIGFAPTGKYTYPKTSSPEDIEASKKMTFEKIPLEDWVWSVTWWSDPIFLGKYPEDVCEKYKDVLPEITEEDMKLISQPIDFIGQNIYDGRMVYCNRDGEPEFVRDDVGFPYTNVNSPVTPEILYWHPKFLYERYKKPVIVTESGMAAIDLMSDDGSVHDGSRIAYLESYLKNLKKAAAEVPIDGYFAWSLMDNFEWAHGYQGRFGLIYVDYRTQKRTFKDSAHWYKKVIESNGGILS